MKVEDSKNKNLNDKNINQNNELDGKEQNLEECGLQAEYESANREEAYPEGVAHPINSSESIKLTTISSFNPDKSTSNKTKNTKYTKYTFFPLVLLQQVKFVSSQYFFLIMVLQFFKELAVSSFWGSVIPFGMVLLISMVNEGVDDFNRHKRDKVSNSSIYQKIVVGKTKEVPIPKEVASCSLSENALGEFKTPFPVEKSISIEVKQNSTKEIFQASSNASVGSLALGSVVFTHVTAPVASANIKTGDIIVIRKGERVPADCILLKSTDQTGEVFIRTDQLDGETDWKRREIISRTIDIDKELIANVEQPSREIYEFKGNLEYYSDENSLENSDNRSRIMASIDVANTAWADTTIATCDVMALVIYTGINTKSKMNTYDPRSKFGIIDRELDFFVVILAIISAVVSLAFTMLRANGFQRNTAIIFLRFLILFSYVIPISLKVTINFARFIYTRNPTSGIVVRNSSIQEELGRISYVLTDKTGTLTKNEMEMRKMHLGNVCFDIFNSEDVVSSIKNSLHLDLNGADLKTKQHDLGSQLDRKVIDALEALSTCHNVTPVETEGGMLYQASSPDEIAIVNYTSSVGVKLISRDRDSMTIEYDLSDKPKIQETGESEENHLGSEKEMIQNSQKYSPNLIREEIKNDDLKNDISIPLLRKTYKIHHIFPFNSDTKRMGVILSLMKIEILDEEHEDGHYPFKKISSKSDEYLFFIKGADSSMKQIIKENDWVEEETDTMARDGLRTLIIAKKTLTKEQYKKFNKAYTSAKLAIANRTESMLKVQVQLENGMMFSTGENSISTPMDLLGLTGVEDKLQDNVKETLESLRTAGIKIWMLTGDKVETAISIAKSSRLFHADDRYMIIKQCTSRIELERQLDTLVTMDYNSLVIDGESISTVLQNDSKNEKYSLLKKFVDATANLLAVIGCRYTPTQKATMAATLKRIRKETVCCIGDGGNDVSMITEADVGVGLEGKEGNQASLASDFSLKRFCLLTDLLLVHGRKCYKNSSNLAHIIIHRGTILSVVQGVFCALIYFIPISILQGRLPSLFICFTFAPLLSIALSKDISDNTAKAYPELYYELRTNRLLSIKEFVSSNLNSFFQGATIIIVLKLFFEEFQQFSVCAFFSLVLNEFLMIILTLERIPLKSMGIIFGSLIFFAVLAPIFHELRSEFGFFSKNILKIALVNLVAIFPKFCIKIYQCWFRPGAHLKVSE